MRLQWTLARVPLLGVVVVQGLVLSVKLVASIKGRANATEARR